MPGDRSAAGRVLFAATLVSLPFVIAMAGRISPTTVVAADAQSELSAAVPWPASGGLVVSEVVTGGASASDEFVEIYNAGAVDVALDGLELAYVSASGSTVSRKQSWTGLWLPPRHHLLVANSAGAWAAAADGVYSGGFAATGGSLVLRSAEGEVIDSLSWGEAASSFVEVTAGPAPAAGSSLERLPGGSGGNGVDTNDNAADSAIQPSPVAQGLASEPVPAATPSRDPTPTTTSDLSPSPSPHGDCPPDASGPDGSLAGVRSLPLGATVTARGRLTTPTRLVDGGALAFIDDGSAGIALRLDSADWDALQLATDVQANGVLESVAGLLVVSMSSPADLAVLGVGSLPEPATVLTGVLCEALEARVIQIEGLITSGPFLSGVGQLSVDVDDGTGPLHVLAEPGTGITTADLAAGARVRVTGVVGQFDPEGDGTGYRVYPRSRADIMLIEAPMATESPEPTPTTEPTATADPTAAPSPTATAAPTAPPSPTSSPSASPTAAHTPTPGATPTATPTSHSSPSPTPAAISISAAREQPVGATVRVSGLVTVAPGWILGESTIAIQDSTAGIFVRLPSGPGDGIVPGRLLDVVGTLADPYDNLELRPSPGGVALQAMSSQPIPRVLRVADLDDSTEGLLARITATVRSIEVSTTGSVTLGVEDESGEGRVFAHATLGVGRDVARVGDRVSATGLVGDRLGLFRLWPRNISDITVIGGDPTPSPAPTRSATPAPTRTASPTPRRSASASPTRSPSPTRTARPSSDPTAAPRMTIADALRRAGQDVTVEGVVTTRPGLFDADGLRVAVQDESAGILVRLPSGFTTGIGDRLRLTGVIGTYYGAPQLTAETADRLGASVPSAFPVRAAPIAASLEWRLVSVSGVVESVHRDGDSWRAELSVPGGGVPVVGVSRSAIPSTALEPGRTATIVGVVKRAYPTAADQRLAIVPRSAADIRLAAGGPRATGHPPGSGASGAPYTPDSAAPGYPNSRTALPGATIAPGSSPAGPGEASADATVVALVDLGSHIGQRVSVGGVVRLVDGVRVAIDDGSGEGVLLFAGEAAALATSILAGDVLNAIGSVVESSTRATEVVVDDPAAVVRVRAGSSGLFAGSAGGAGASPYASFTPAQSGAPQDAAPTAAPVPSAAPTAAGVVAILLLAAAVALLAASTLARPAHRHALVARVSAAGDWLARRLARLRPG